MKLISSEEENMKEKIQSGIVDRRNFVLGASAAAAFATFASFGSTPASAKGKPWEGFLKEAIGDANPEKGKITFAELPKKAQNGSAVPYVVVVDSPMTEKDYVKAIHVFATDNPGPQIVSASFTPLSGKAYVKGKMRLAKTQTVVAVAQMSNGKTYMVEQHVKVDKGGCG